MDYLACPLNPTLTLPFTRGGNLFLLLPLRKRVNMFLLLPLRKRVNVFLLLPLRKRVNMFLLLPLRKRVNMFLLLPLVKGEAGRGYFYAFAETTSPRLSPTKKLAKYIASPAVNMTPKPNRTQKKGCSCSCVAIKLSALASSGKR